MYYTPMKICGNGKPDFWAWFWWTWKVYDWGEMYCQTGVRVLGFNFYLWRRSL